MMYRPSAIMISQLNLPSNWSLVHPTVLYSVYCTLIVGRPKTGNRRSHDRILPTRSKWLQPTQQIQLKQDFEQKNTAKQKRRNKSIPKYLFTISLFKNLVNSCLRTVQQSYHHHHHPLSLLASHQASLGSELKKRAKPSVALRPLPIFYQNGQNQTKRDKNDMKIATLQFAPKLGDTQGNIQRADELLSKGGGSGIEGLKPDVLVLSEMALTG